MITILTVADADIGLGHLYRCDALCQAFSATHPDSRLVVACSAGTDWLRKRSPSSRYSILAWNTKRSAFVEASRGSAAVIIDAYSIESEVWTAAPALESALVVFDDFGEKPSLRGTLVNGGPSAERMHYATRRDRRLLLGPRYQVLRRPFWRGTQRFFPDRIGRVGVMIGGTDPRNLTERVVEVIRAEYPPETEIIAIRPGGAGDDHNSQQSNLSAPKVKEALDSFDLLISGAGQTVSEAVSCQLPTVMLQIARNQSGNAAGWSRLGAALFAGDVNSSDWVPQLAASLRKVAPRTVRESMGRSAAAVDIHNSTERLRQALELEMRP